MICKNCGMEITDGTQVCKQCGLDNSQAVNRPPVQPQQPVQTAAIQNAAAASRNTALITALAVVCTLIVCLIAGLVIILFMMKEKDNNNDNPIAEIATEATIETITETAPDSIESTEQNSTEAPTEAPKETSTKKKATTEPKPIISSKPETNPLVMAMVENEAEWKPQDDYLYEYQEMWFQDLNFDGINELIVGGYGGGTNRLEYYSVYSLYENTISGNQFILNCYTQQPLLELCKYRNSENYFYVNSNSENAGVGIGIYYEFNEYRGMFLKTIVRRFEPDDYTKKDACWFNGEREEITQKEYAQIYNSYIKNLTKYSYTIDKITLTDYDAMTRDEKIKRLQKSYDAFAIGGEIGGFEQYVANDKVKDDANNENAVSANGTCGKNLKWNLNSDGVLTISGSGLMYSYGTDKVYSDKELQDSFNSPWYKYNEHISKIVVESGVTSIGTYAFSNAKAKEIEIAATVESIDNYSFNKCSNLKSITIPNSVTAIGACAFSGCSGLKDIVISKNIDLCSATAFDGTAWYNVQPEGVLYLDTIVLGYKGETGKLISCTAQGNGELTDININIYKYPEIDIKEGTTYIAQFAFQNCYGLKRVSIPDSVRSIGIGAFMNCVSLEEVRIGNGLERIEYGAFSNCHSLSSVYLNPKYIEITKKPDNIIFPAAEAFSFCHDSLTVYGKADSYAKTFAEQKGFIYKEIN